MKHIYLALILVITIGCSSCHEIGQILEPTSGTQTGNDTSPSDSETPSSSGLSNYRNAGHPLSTHGVGYSDIPYASDSRNGYDLILPAQKTEGELMPLVVFFHGGGFVQGNKNSLYKKPSVLKEMEVYLDKGIAVANVNYRLLEPNEKVGVMKCLEDAKYLVQRIKYESPANGINPNKIILRGTSAGASMGLWLALHDDMAIPESSDPILRQSTRIAGVVAENAQSTLDVTRWEEVFKAYNYKYDEGLDAEMKARLYGIYGLSAPSGKVDRLSFETATEAYRNKVDFASFMDQNDPPIFVANKPKLDGPPVEKNLLFHHREHAHFLEEQSKKVGGTFDSGNAFYFETDPSVKDLTDFVEKLVK